MDSLNKCFGVIKQWYCPPNQLIPRLASSVAFLGRPNPTYEFKFDSNYNKYVLKLNKSGRRMNRKVLRHKSHNCDRYEKFCLQLHKFDVFYTQTRNGHRIACLYRRSRWQTKVTILFSQCNATDLGYISGWLWTLYRRTRVNIICYDYSSYGLSTGQPYEDNLYSAIDSVVASLIYRYDIWPKDIILFGESIGSVPTIDISTRVQFRGVILDSLIASGLRVVLADSLTRNWSFDPFSNLQKVDKIKCKVLILHGSNDHLTDIADAIALYQKCPKKVAPFWAYGYGHNFVRAHPRYYKRLRHFIDNETDQLDN